MFVYFSSVEGVILRCSLSHAVQREHVTINYMRKSHKCICIALTIINTLLDCPIMQTHSNFFLSGCSLSLSLLPHSPKNRYIVIFDGLTCSPFAHYILRNIVRSFLLSLIFIIKIFTSNNNPKSYVIAVWLPIHIYLLFTVVQPPNRRLRNKL